MEPLVIKRRNRGSFDSALLMIHCILLIGNSLLFGISVQETKAPCDEVIHHLVITPSATTVTAATTITTTTKAMMPMMRSGNLSSNTMLAYYRIQGESQES